MKSGIIMAMLFAATLACGAGRVQAAPPPNPWGIIVYESLSEYCHGGDWIFGEHSLSGENPLPVLGPPHGPNLAGGPSGPPGPPPSTRSFTGEDGRPPVMMPRENDTPCQMKLLGLTDAQKKRIATIILEEREKALPVLKKRAEAHERLRQTERATNLDEKSMRSIWGNVAQLEADMMISRAKTRNRIRAVLTPAQRDLVKKLESGMGHYGKREGKHE